MVIFETFLLVHHIERCLSSTVICLDFEDSMKSLMASLTSLSTKCAAVPSISSDALLGIDMNFNFNVDLLRNDTSFVNFRRYWLPSFTKMMASRKLDLRIKNTDTSNPMKTPCRRFVNTMAITVMMNGRN